MTFQDGPPSLAESLIFAISLSSVPGPCKNLQGTAGMFMQTCKSRTSNLLQRDVWSGRHNRQPRQVLHEEQATCDNLHACKTIDLKGAGQDTFAQVTLNVVSILRLPQSELGGTRWIPAVLSKHLLAAVASDLAEGIIGINQGVVWQAAICNGNSLLDCVDSSVL